MGGEPRFGTTATYMRRHDHRAACLSIKSIDYMTAYITNIRSFLQLQLKWSKFGLAHPRRCAHRAPTPPPPLADMAHPVDGETPVPHRRLDRDGKGLRPAARILADDEAIDTGQRQRAFDID